MSNVFLARMASEEFAVTMRERGSRRRLEGLEGWEALRLRTILVDPPRAGLDDFTVELLKVRACGEGREVGGCRCQPLLERTQCKRVRRRAWPML